MEDGERSGFGEDGQWKFVDWLCPPPLRLSAHLPLAGEGLVPCRGLLIDNNPSGASRPFAQWSHWERLFTVLLEEVLDAGLNFFGG